mmetsp:Transcript_3788/g.5340  ORF Transcript_3788/g.5340 Transcript_3788/m.5340 type:complete len:120 (+) Transcript_3788:280-639(+)
MNFNNSATVETIEDFDEDQDLSISTWNFENIFSQLQPTLIMATMSILFFGGMVTFFRPLVMNAAAETSIVFSQPLFDPASFQPVCPASDGFYQVMKSFIGALIGQENIAEYGPLIASGK